MSDERIKTLAEVSEAFGVDGPGLGLVSEGGQTFSTVVYADDPDKAFRTAVDQARHEHGHGGYTGSIAEKDGWRWAPGAPRGATPEQARSIVRSTMDRNDKWDPAFCIEILDKHKEVLQGEARWTPGEGGIATVQELEAALRRHGSKWAAASSYGWDRGKGGRQYLDGFLNDAVGRKNSGYKTEKLYDMMRSGKAKVRFTEFRAEEKTGLAGMSFNQRRQTYYQVTITLEVTAESKGYVFYGWASS